MCNDDCRTEALICGGLNPIASHKDRKRLTASLRTSPTDTMVHAPGTLSTRCRNARCLRPEIPLDAIRWRRQQQDARAAICAAYSHDAMVQRQPCHRNTRLAGIQCQLAEEVFSRVFAHTPYPSLAGPTFHIVHILFSRKNLMAFATCRICSPCNIV